MNAGELSRRMAENAAAIVEHLLPNGKRKSGEWKAGSVSGEAGQSLSVRLSGAKAGVWKDFATDEGGDLLDLWMAARGLSIAEAMDEAKAYLCIRDDKLAPPKQQFKRPKKPRCQAPKVGVKEWLNGRGITDETIAAFRIGEQLRGDKTYAVFPYLRDGELVNAKYRNVAEKRDMRQEGGAEPCLFGWHLIDPKQRTIAVAEGECFPLDAQVLTRDGWIAIGDWDGQNVAQWDAGNVSFVRPIAYVKKMFAGNLVRHETRGYVSITTPGHNLVVQKYKKDKFYKLRADARPEAKADWIPRCGVLDGPGIQLTDAQIRLSLAISADGTIDTRKQSYGGGPARVMPAAERYVRIGLKKPRKIARLRELLKCCGIEASDNPMPSHEGYWSICFPCPGFAPGRLLPFEWIVDATYRQRQLMLDELVHWDGNSVRNRNQTEYSTKTEHNAVWAQTLAHTSGIVSSIIRRENAVGKWNKVSLLHGKQHSSWQGIKTTEQKHDGEVACVQVPSGALLVRQEDKITVSGNCDAMVLHQVGIPALSVNAGAGNHQWIENDWDRLQRFSEILLFYDSDEAGQKGAREVAHRLGEERCKLVRLPAKDANEYLQQGADGSDFWECIRQAKTLDPEELRNAADFMDQVKAMFYPVPGQERAPVLHLDRDLDWFEFRRGELTVWTGRNGHGKSLMLSQVLIGLMAQGERCVVFSGEMMPARLMKRAAKQITGVDRPTPGYLDAVAGWLSSRMWIFNVVGSAALDRLLAVFMYAVKRYDVRHFVIDSLMMTDVPEDGPGAMTKQKEAIQKMADFVKQNNCHLHLVAHPRKGLKDADVPDKSDVAGSSKITDGADNVFTVWSKSKDESEENADQTDPDGHLQLRKQRNGDVQHYTQWLWFNRDVMQFTSDSRRRPVRFVEFEGDPVFVADEEEQGAF